jgi:hypothetical protein
MSNDNTNTMQKRPGRRWLVSGMIFIFFLGVGTFVSDTFDVLVRSNSSVLEYSLKYIGTAFCAWLASLVYIGHK